MPQVSTLVFGLSNATNPFEAALLADQIDPEHRHQATPKVGLPPDWVLEHASGPVDDAAFAVRYCYDTPTLVEVARRARRYTVITALCANPHLPNATYLELVQRVTPDQAHTIRNQPRVDVLVDFAERPLDEVLADQRSYNPPPRRSTLPSLLRYVRSHLEEYPGAIDVLLCSAAAFGDMAPAIEFAAHYYEAPGTFADLWDTATLTPVEVINLYVGDAKLLLLANVTRSVIASSTQRRLIDTDLVSTVMETSARSYPIGAAKKRQVFTDAALDLILASPEWIVLLGTQELSDEQFTNLVSSAPQHRIVNLFHHLDTSRQRLATLVARGTGPDGFEPGALYEMTWANVLACLHDPQDGFIEALLPFSINHLLLDYLTGHFLVTNPKGERVVVIPKIEAVEMIGRLNPNEIQQISWRVTGRNSALPEEYVLALLLDVPDMWKQHLGHYIYGPSIYKYLSENGKTLEEIMDLVENRETTTLRSCLVI